MLTRRHTAQQILCPEASTPFSAVTRSLGIVSTEAMDMPLVPPVSKMSRASRKGASTALICIRQPKSSIVMENSKWRRRFPLQFPGIEIGSVRGGGVPYLALYCVLDGGADLLSDKSAAE